MIWLRKTGAGLFPCDAEGETKVQAMKDGQTVEVSVKKRSHRSYQQLKMAFEMIEITFPNQDQFKTKQALREALTLEAGFTRLVKKMNGEAHMVPLSWSYDELGHERFCELVDGVRNVIIATWEFDPLGEQDE